MKTMLKLAAAILVHAALASAAAAAEIPDPTERMREGKAAFEKSCGFCHSLDRSLSRTKTRR